MFVCPTHSDAYSMVVCLPCTALPLPKLPDDPSYVSPILGHTKEKLCLQIRAFFLPGLFLHMCQADPGLLRGVPHQGFTQGGEDRGAPTSNPQGRV